MMQNINRGNRETHMEYKYAHQPWPYLNHFQVTAKRMKKLQIAQKASFLKYKKNATQKRSTYLERAEKILRDDINGIRMSRFNG